MANPDEHSVEWCLAALAAFGCPDVRRAEGTAEWERTRGGYRFSPDLVAGPLVGSGDPSDFYVDVFAPSGDQYVKPLAGNPRAAVTFVRSIAERDRLNLAELGDTFEQLLRPINQKLTKYSGSRGGTPMVGLGMYFRMTGNQYVGPIVAALQALVGLDGALGITHHLGPGVAGRLMRALLSPGQSSFILSLPIEQPLSFVLYLAEKVDGPRAVLIVNHNVVRDQHPYPDHPVVRWLRQVAAS